MALIYNGKNIPTTAKNIKYNGVSLDRVYYGSTLVWEYKLPVVTIANPKISTCSKFELLNENDECWMASESPTYIQSNSGLSVDIRNCSYGTVNFEGLLQSMNLTGYNRIELTIQSLDRIGDCTMSVGGYSVTDNLHGQSGDWITLILTIPTNLGTRNISFSVNPYRNSPNKANVDIGFYFSELVLKYV